MVEYTVIGFIDDSGDAQVAGVIDGNHAVTQSYYDRWWVVAEADSVGQAETLALSKIDKQLEKEEENG
jgi:hypothetical protein